MLCVPPLYETYRRVLRVREGTSSINHQDIGFCKHSSALTLAAHFSNNEAAPSKFNSRNSSNSRDNNHNRNNHPRNSNLNSCG